MKELSDEDLKRRFRFTLWLNADRNEAFFADRVVLVEGSTDKAVFQWLMAKHKSDIKGLAAKICDCGSKGNIPYFMKLFSDLAVPHYVLHDDDHDKNDDHKKMNKAIQDARTSHTIDIDPLPGNLEEYLGLPKASSYRKPAEALFHLEENDIDDDKAKRLLKAFA